MVHSGAKWTIDRLFTGLYFYVIRWDLVLRGNMSAFWKWRAWNMKSTGVVRKLDNLGRIVIPIELRKTMDIAIKDTLEIFTEGDEIILKKYQPGCIFCNDARNVTLFKGKLVCEKCLAELKQQEHD